MERVVRAALDGEPERVVRGRELGPAILAALVTRPRGAPASELRALVRRRKQAVLGALALLERAALVARSGKRCAPGGGTIWRITALGRRVLRGQFVTLRAGTPLAA